MAKFYDKIGFAETTETSPGVWTEGITTKFYSGDLRKNMKRLDPGENLNDNVDISNRISIVANPYAMQNFHRMRYVEWMGVRWEVKSVDVNYPRLTINLGGVYNGPVAT